MLGFVFYRPVPRYVTPDRVAEIVRDLRRDTQHWLAVGVFVNEAQAELNAIAEQCGLDWVQLAGDETAEYCRHIERPAIKVLRVREGRWSADRLAESRSGFDVERFMVDSHVSGYYGGTGVASDWASLAGLMDGHILAGGLRPDNVADAIRVTSPWGVDVSTGVETDGRKDRHLMRRFCEAARSANPTVVS